MAKKKGIKSKSGGVLSRAALYSYAAKYSIDAIEILVDLMHNAKQESVRIAASKTMLDTELPDLKAMELSGDDHGPLRIQIIEEKFKLDE